MVPNTRPLSDLVNHAEQLLAELEETRSPLVLTSEGHAKAVLQDVDSYNQLQESLAMMKMLLSGKEQVRNGETFDAFETIQAIRESRNR